MTDGYLMDADCIHGNAWYECDECMADDPDSPMPKAKFDAQAARDAAADSAYPVDRGGHEGAR